MAAASDSRDAMPRSGSAMLRKRRGGARWGALSCFPSDGASSRDFSQPCARAQLHGA